MTGPVDRLVSLAELGDRGGLAGAGRPGQDQAAAGADRVPVQQRQAPSGGDDLPQRRGSHHAEAGVIIQPLLVISRPGVTAEGSVLVPGQKPGRGGHGGGEAAPALQRGKVPVRITARRHGPGAFAGNSARHHGFLASSKGSKMPSGITLAIGSSLCCPGASGPSSVVAGTAWTETPAPARDAVVARVRAATRRSRAVSCRPGRRGDPAGSASVPVSGGPW